MDMEEEKKRKSEDAVEGSAAKVPKVDEGDVKSQPHPKASLPVRITRLMSLTSCSN